MATVEFQLNGSGVVVDASIGSLLDALRDGLGVRSPKDGCSPQGQCGCCTVWVDGQPRVACVTPVTRVAGRSVTTVEGLDAPVRDRWAHALCATGGSQCGFCTPGIVMRLAALPEGATDAAVRQALLAHLCRCTGWQTIVEAAVAPPRTTAAASSGAHPRAPGRDLAATVDSQDPQPPPSPVGEARPSPRLGEGAPVDPPASADGGLAAQGAPPPCPPGWQKLHLADQGFDAEPSATPPSAGVQPSGSAPAGGRDLAAPDGRSSGSAQASGRALAAAAVRAALEGGAAQVVGPEVVLGRGGFADDVAPAGALVAMRSASGEWVVGATVPEARRLAGKVQGRKSTIGSEWPIEVPPGEWARTLQTTWVEPGYLEPDAVWCEPGGEPVGPLTNGGAFGGKRSDDLGAVARRLADEHGAPVRVLLSREDVVRLGPKRPPVAAALRADGTGIVRIARSPGLDPGARPGGAAVGGWPGMVEAIRSILPGVEVEQVEVAGPPTSADLRAAGWAEAAVLRASLGEAPDTVTAPNGAVASATIDGDGTVHARVRCGRPLDEVVLRSYCIGAAHMALGWVRSEAIAVDAAGTVHDLTIRSFGILRAVDTPHIEVDIEPDDGEPVNGSDAVFAAVAAAAWRHAAFPPRWPTSP